MNGCFTRTHIPTHPVYFDCACCTLLWIQDASDPDLDLPNKVHLLQTAEGIRRAGYVSAFFLVPPLCRFLSFTLTRATNQSITHTPHGGDDSALVLHAPCTFCKITHRHPDWMQLTGLLHDMGKIMFLWGTAEDGQESSSSSSSNGGGGGGKQWALGGDTWVVGCPIPDSVILPHLNALNPDQHDPRYNGGSPTGMYTPHCGLDRLLFAWGHDEYMYRMLVANDSQLPREALDMIRYHSAYPLHEKGAYRHLLLLPADEERLDWVRLFNQFDLYTKDNDNDSVIRERLDELWPYYQGLLKKYGLDGVLKW